MTRSEVKVHKLQKWPISESVFYADMHVIKRLMVNYDTAPRQYVNFNLTCF